MEIAIYDYLFATFAFVLGATVGSFLNVCIYRMPLGLSVNEPRRSFCPQCKSQIPWSQNLPLISWLALRGRCAKCGCRIPFSYFGVELLTAMLFLAVWLKFWHAGAWVLALPYWIFVSLLIVATFIDFEHFIIPDEITWGGAAAGILLSFGIPPLMGEESNLAAGLWSIIGAVSGFATLWLVVELGKKAFGRKRVTFDPPSSFIWTRKGDDADLKIGDDTMPWSDLFSREQDQLLMTCVAAEIEGTRHENVTLTFFYNRVIVKGAEFPLDKLDTISGTVCEVTIPREAMGFGDVKFIAAIGAFLGWQAVFFTIMSASVVGAFVGVAAILAGKREWSAKIPFGPYLALGALIWLFAGPQLLHWYLHRLGPPL